MDQKELKNKGLGNENASNEENKNYLCQLIFAVFNFDFVDQSLSDFDRDLFQQHEECKSITPIPSFSPVSRHMDRQMVVW